MDDLFFDYHIPPQLKEQIPEHFYYALGGELVSIFGKDVLIWNADGFNQLEYASGTAGFSEALKASCKKLDMMWLFNYREHLRFDQSDIFDGEIATDVMRCFDRDESVNSYYKYLLSKED